MHIDQARSLQAALGAAIAKAEAEGSTEVRLVESLDAQLGDAIDELAGAIAAKGGTPPAVAG